MTMQQAHLINIAIIVVASLISPVLNGSLTKVSTYETCQGFNTRDLRIIHRPKSDIMRLRDWWNKWKWLREINQTAHASRSLESGTQSFTVWSHDCLTISTCPIYLFCKMDKYQVFPTLTGVGFAHVSLWALGWASQEIDMMTRASSGRKSCFMVFINCPKV